MTYCYTSLILPPQLAWLKCSFRPLLPGRGAQAPLQSLVSCFLNGSRSPRLQPRFILPDCDIILQTFDWRWSKSGLQTSFCATPWAPGSNDLSCWRHDMRSGISVTGWTESPRYTLTIYCPSPVGSTHQSGGSPILALSGPDYRPLRLQLTRMDRVHNFRRPFPSQRLTWRGSWGAWSRANWAVDRQVHTLLASLESNLGAESWRLGGDIVILLCNFYWCWPPFAAETDVLTLLSKIIFVWKPCGTPLIWVIYCWVTSLYCPYLGWD